MPHENTLFKNLTKPFALRENLGNTGYYEAAASTEAMACQFAVLTGTTACADITPTQAANVTLVADSKVPSGLRCYITSVTLALLGEVSWTNTSPTAGAVPFLSLQDSAGVPFVHVPFNALKGGQVLKFPVPEIRVPLLLGPSTVNGSVGTPNTTFTYVASTGVITAGAAMFVANIGVGGTVRVVDGTGKGQAAIITVVTDTTHITVSPAFTGLDATSVLAVDYQAVKTATDTTHSTLYNSTNFTSNAMDAGLFMQGVLGTGQGQTRPIIANSTVGAMTYSGALSANVDTTTSLIQVTSAPALNGAIDCCVGSKFATLTAAKGLVAVVNNQGGTTPLGSAVRVYVEGYFA